MTLFTAYAVKSVYFFLAGAILFSGAIILCFDEKRGDGYAGAFLDLCLSQRLGQILS